MQLCGERFARVVKRCMRVLLNFTMVSRSSGERRERSDEGKARVHREDVYGV